MSDYPRLDEDGLLYLTQQLKAKMEGYVPGDMTGATDQTNGAHGLVPQPNAGQEGMFLKGNGTWATPAGTPNTIESISVNNTNIPPDINKNVNISVPVATSELTNDSGFQTGSDVDTKIAAALTSTLKPGGQVTFANLPTLTAANLGFVYDVTDAFTSTSDFTDGGGKNYPAGTNVAIVNTGTNLNPVYKYDAGMGFVDLSGYVQGTQMTAISNADIDTIIDTVWPQS